MIFRRLYHDRLAQASYLIACETTRQAIVVDPLRDPEPYLEAAALDDVRIAFVTETHSTPISSPVPRRSRDATGAELLLSAEGERRRESTRACAAPARRALRDGDAIDARARAARCPTHAGPHARASRVRRHRRSDEPTAGRHPERRLPLRRRRRSSRSARARRRREGLDAALGRAALPLAADASRAARLPAGLARPWRGLRVRQVARRGSADHARLRAANELGVPGRRRGGRSCARCSPTSPSRRRTSR